MTTTRLEAVQLADKGKLLPCPFCGDSNERLPDRIIVDRTLRAGYEGKYENDRDAYSYAVTCLSCAARGPWVKSSKRAAMVEWNVRMKAAVDTNNRIKTMIEPLDVALEGGLDRNASYLIAGPTGIGKTTLLRRIAKNIGLANDQQNSRGHVSFALHDCSDALAAEKAIRDSSRSDVSMLDDFLQCRPWTARESKATLSMLDVVAERKFCFVMALTRNNDARVPQIEHQFDVVMVMHADHHKMETGRIERRVTMSIIKNRIGSHTDDVVLPPSLFRAGSDTK